MSIEKPVIWNGIEYKSIADAARALDIEYATMSARVRRGLTCDADMREAVISQQTRDEVIRLHKEGLNREAIAAKVGISLPSVRKALALEGFGENLRKGDYGKDESTTQEKEKFIELYNQGYTAEQAAEQVGYGKGWGLSILIEYAEQVEKTSYGNISEEAFIKLWQTALSLDAVAEKLNLSKIQILSRARRLKNRGVPLKKLRSQKGHDWDELALYAAMLLEEE